MIFHIELYFTTVKHNITMQVQLALSDFSFCNQECKEFVHTGDLMEAHREM